MLFKITDVRTGKSYITDSELDYKEKSFNNAYDTKTIDTNISVNAYNFFNSLSKDLDSAIMTCNGLVGTIRTVVEENPTDTELDAERLQIADNAIQGIQDLERLVSNFLGKKVE